MGLTAILSVLLALTPGAAAHEQRKTPHYREIVWIQGALSDAPASDTTVVRTVELRILGSERRLQATAWHRFGAETKDPPPPPPGAGEPARITLHGERGDLQRLRHAPPGQRVTLLGEQRSGSTDLFLLALDLCPSD
jgi:hypothetical protein